MCMDVSFFTAAENKNILQEFSEYLKFGKFNNVCIYLIQQLMFIHILYIKVISLYFCSQCNAFIILYMFQLNNKYNNIQLNYSSTLNYSILFHDSLITNNPYREYSS